MSWLAAAAASALFAGITSILAKLGMRTTDPDIATAVRTTVVLAMAWAVTAAAGSAADVAEIAPGQLMFLGLSGLATGASWLFFYYAVAFGPVSIVIPLDKLSILVTMLFAAVVLKERFTPRTLAGLALMTASTVAMAALA